MATNKLVSFEYEIFGKVQGVFFRKNTEKKAKELGIVGWVKNTTHRTVTGKAQGPEEKMKVMKEWLQKTGSPKSRIDRAVFQNEKSLSALEYAEFKIK